jgi:hypothetical protein
MSKLAKAITYALTGNKKAIRDMKFRYTDVDIHMRETYGTYNIAKEVLIQTKLSANAWVKETFHKNYGSQEEEFKEVLYDVKRAMIEEVFGEFRPILIEMKSALHDEDTTRIRALIADLEYKMFVED